jgi:hypothetical protein
VIISGRAGSGAASEMPMLPLSTAVLQNGLKVNGSSAARGESPEHVLSEQALRRAPGARVCVIASGSCFVFSWIVDS